MLSGDEFCVIRFCLFIFKQKTAYEMRISDWSSDVCSSDLQRQPLQPHDAGGDRLGLAQTPLVHAELRLPADQIMGPGIEVVPGEIGRASCRERVCQYV